MTVPQATLFLPDLMPFIEALARDTQSGEVNSWENFGTRVEAFFTPEQMTHFNRVIDGWQTMASYSNGVTLIHVNAVLVSLLLCPEYQAMSPEDQNLMLWIVLFHDVAKVAMPGQRDFIHAFRSTVMAARVLSKLGFTVHDEIILESWCTLTWNAITPTIPSTQDNSQLPAIIKGIRHHFGMKTPATLILETILFHMSINVVSEYPQAAPLAPDEIDKYIHAELVPLLKCMMLVDSDAWALFDPATKSQHRAETLIAFGEIS